MKKKRIIIVGIVFLVLLIVVFLITSSVTFFKYQKEHIMIYPPTDEEQVELAHDMGLILSSDVHIDAAMLCRAREDVDSGYSVRVTGVDDAYVFLSENINIIDSIRKEDETLYINENPISFDNEVVSYEGYKTYRGFETTVNVTGKKEPNGTREFEYPCKLTFFLMTMINYYLLNVVLNMSHMEIHSMK
ncbi:MAG: hypothetical protein K6F83_04990 [Clostridiales bacterium]|nr:hypothetical protein [Clostridiales bacterium]